VVRALVRPLEDPVPNVPATPLATYRLQFTPRFGFNDARAIVPYLAALGVDFIYASPYLKARPGSEHGYDVVDPNRLNPEIGTPEEHAAFIATAQAAGLGHLLDFVPNHMGIGVQNPWWQDVLEWGEASPYGNYFDIDWQPLREEMRGRVLVPALGDYYGRVLERGELIPAFDSKTGSFSITYFENAFPLAPTSYGDLLALAAAKHGAGEAWALRALAAEFTSADRARAIELKAELAGAVARDDASRVAIEAALATYCAGDDPAAIDKLDALLQAQHYRLSYWRVSADEINYRRFFDINDLAGVRVEDAEVLAQTHRLAFELIERGLVQGLRIDHVDGLFDPAGYCRFLHDRAEALGQPLYLVVEKILARFESLRGDWPIAGTTGYDFMNEVNGLFVDGRSELAFDRLYRRFAGISADFEMFAYRAKKDIMRLALASELEVLANMFDRIAKEDRRSNDFTYNVLHDALVETVASFPVYRTYATGATLEEEDRRYIGWAIGSARKRSELGDPRVFDFLEDVLTLAAPATSANYDGREILRFAMKFQQYTSPVMAKAVEDTAFYRYVRLASLNEVGGDPRRFGTSIAAFHRASSRRAAEHPLAMLATATHDHKRGEDTRLRIDALSEMPGFWDRTIKRWNRLNARRKVFVDNAAAPTDNDEYHLYQTLIGTWPAQWLALDQIPQDEMDVYIERIEGYLRKALREAKFRTSWANPNLLYEDATLKFARALLQPKRGNAFLAGLQSVSRECAMIGALSGLAQVTLKLTVPGVPDIYQGTELWDLSLVDPDNRRAVDYGARAALIDGFAARERAGELAQLAAELRSTWHDGRVKAFVLWRLLHVRRERPQTFTGSTYLPLATDGGDGEHLVAFARDDVVVAVPRLTRRLAEERDGLAVLFDDERILLPESAASEYVDRFTGATIRPRSDDNGRFLYARELFANFPVSVLVAK
jgi:(1->4)-alpha-D-glucan 1-alpha-D-glucosylmutase